MLTIVWNLRGFHLIKVLEKGRKFNTGHYVAEILEPLSQWRSIEAAGDERKFGACGEGAPTPPSYQFNILTRIE
jgi:hypothetical protein